MLYGLMPVKNEADRWLTQSLFHLNRLGIPIYVCDDQSIDASMSIAEAFENVTITTRPDDVPSFLEHESEFRQWCWDCVPATDGDYILCVDADEFLVSIWGAGRERELLEHLTKALDRDNDYWLLSLDVGEVWAFDDDGNALVRTDGFWAHNGQVRLAKWFPDAKFRDRKMGSLAVPDHPNYGPVAHGWGEPTSIQILHYGYALDEDKQAKYLRYSTHPAGHNEMHVNSILAPAKLEPWPYETPVKMSSDFF